jgi:two-component system response regulator MprA
VDGPWFDPARPRLLLVEDDRDLSGLLEGLLRDESYAVTVARDGQRGLHLGLSGRWELMVVDRGLPAIEGVDLVSRLRARGVRAPVLMLTARGTVTDRVEGLDAGATDYLVKPFDVEELLARLRALLRRAGTDEPAELRVGDLVLDPVAHRASRGDRPLDLTRTEFALLQLFLANPERALARSAIYQAVWGYDFGPGSNSLDVYIGYLRRKTEAGGEPRVVHTLRGVGFVLRAP